MKGAVVYGKTIETDLIAKLVAKHRIGPSTTVGEVVPSLATVVYGNVMDGRIIFCLGLATVNLSQSNIEITI